MKRFLRFAVLSLAVAAFWACDDKEYVDPGMEVNPNNIAGTWQLTEWNGSPLAENSFVYIELIRKDRKYKMYQNLDSFGTRLRTGSYYIYTEPQVGAIIRGDYDYGVGDWQHRYIVRDLSANRMVWIAKDNADDISVYERCASIPDEVIGNAKAE